MSVKVMSMIWDRLNVAGGELNLALTLGDHGNDRGESIFPGVDRMCLLTRQSRATVQRQLAHFREIGWLEPVADGGLVGGRGHTTSYRINPTWIRGEPLQNFPDIDLEREAQEKGLKMRPFPSARSVNKPPHSSEALSSDKGPHPEGERASPDDGKGLTAMRRDPSGTIIKPLSDGPRASPTGSRSAPNEDAYDVAARVNHWRRLAGGIVIGECNATQIARGRATVYQDLPENVRREMRPKIERYVTETVERERPPTRYSYPQLYDMLERELRMELRAFRPPTPAEIAAGKGLVA